MQIIHRLDGRLEWVCEHGIGHTIAIPLWKGMAQEDKKIMWVHGCDSCCPLGDKNG